MHAACRLMSILLMVAVANASATAVASERRAGAGRWELMESAPGSNSCARLTGNEVDTMLMLNGNAQLILVAGRADWHASGSEEIALRIDDIRLEHLTAGAFNNLVLLPITDEAILKRLKTAKNLIWSLPSGKYHAVVAGLGEALEWLHACEQGKH
jgi:hypothetical protein